MSEQPEQRETEQEWERAFHTTSKNPSETDTPCADIQAAVRRLRQANLAGVLAESEHRNAALCEQAWKALVECLPTRHHSHLALKGAPHA